MTKNTDSINKMTLCLFKTYLAPTCFSIDRESFTPIFFLKMRSRFYCSFTNVFVLCISGHIGYKSITMNYAVGYGRRNSSLASIIRRWFREGKYYDKEFSVCQYGHTCQRYMQVTKYFF